MTGTIIANEMRGGRQWAQVELDCGPVSIKVWLPVPEHHYAFVGARWEVGLIQSLER